MPAPAYADADYRAARRRLLASHPACVHCGDPAATIADHQPPLSLHHHRPRTGCCELVPSCQKCSTRQGAKLSGRMTATLRPHRPSPAPSAGEVADPVGYPATDPVWDVPWLDGLRDLPESATWPRLMTRPHPRAVDSYGDAVVAAAATRGVQLRWWQRLAAVRLLEHDDAGGLVWRDAVVSTARQVGKSWLLVELCQWRLDAAGELFDPDQLIVHTARKLDAAVNVHRRARRRADPDRYKVRLSHGEEELERRDDGSRWMVRSKQNVVSMSADMVVIDEAWDVDAADVETDLIPTMAARPDSQLVMWSTAHRSATALVMSRRAVLDVTDTTRGLHLEWSAPRDAALDDRTAWRQASPHWDGLRESFIEARYAAAVAGETVDDTEPDPTAGFTTQYLNWWPLRRAVPRGPEPLLPAGVWDACTGSLDAVTRVVVAVEDYFGKGAAVAYVAGDVARYEVDGELCANLDEAWVQVRRFVDRHPAATVITGANLRHRIPDDYPNRVGVRLAGARELARTLPLLRALAAAGQVCHDDTPDVDAQLAAARVSPNPTGGLTLASGRADLVHAVVWALDACHTPTPAPAIR